MQTTSLVKQAANKSRLLAFVLKELRELWPPTLFFAIGFNLILLTTQLIRVLLGLSRITEAHPLNELPRIDRPVACMRITAASVNPWQFIEGVCLSYPAE